MISTFAHVIDSYRTTTTADRAVASDTLELTNAPSGSLPDNRIYRITAVTNPDEEIITILEATGKSENTLTGVTISSGYDDVEFPSGTIIDIRICAKDISELQDALNIIETIFTFDVMKVSVAEGNATASGDYSHAEGNGTALGNYSHAENDTSNANGDYSHAEGKSTASGPYSHAEGNGSTASGDDSHAECRHTVASGNYSHAEGDSTQAQSDASHAEGYDSIASGNYSHAEGYSTQAQNEASHAEGYDTIASGDHSHVEGTSSVASGDDSHAEGNSSVASGICSHAEGYTTASGDYSHAEGQYGTASGASSHIEGYDTVASGEHSHAGGNGAISDMSCQWSRSDGFFGTEGDGQHSIIQLSASTTNGTPKVLSIGGGLGGTAFLVIKAGFTYGFTVTVLGRKTDGSAHAYFIRQGVISNEVGTTALIGIVTTVGTDNNIPVWGLTITADDTNDALAITVTGAASTEIRWVARVDLIQIGS